MCGRFTLSCLPDEIAAFLGIPIPADWKPRYNVAPSQAVLSARTPAAGGREWARLKWGLVPSWADDESIGWKMINARSETAAAKPSFRQAFRRRRCLIPADGFFEWKAEGKKKKPLWFHRPDGKPFVFAGLWEHKEREGQEPLETCTILTTTANETVRPYHDRMPVILGKDDAIRWLDIGLSAELAEGLLKPIDDGFLTVERVSEIVNSPKVDDARCLERVATGDLDWT